MTTKNYEKRVSMSGTKHDWCVVVLGDRYTWDKTFCQHDPRDLESTKSAAEARVRWANRVSL